MKGSTSFAARLGWALILLLVTSLGACGGTSPVADSGLQWRHEIYTRLHDRLRLPVAERTRTMSAKLLDTLRDFDRSLGIEGTERYRPRPFTPQERDMLAAYIAKLPPAHRRLFRDKLLGIFIVENFSGAALTDWAISPNNQPYYYLVLNSRVLTTPLDEWLSLKANSFFQSGAPLPTLQVHTHTDYTALMYALLHEGAHIVDYDRGITPFVEREQRALLGPAPQQTPFTNGVWESQDRVVGDYDYPQRGKLNVYGIFPAKGLLPQTDMMAMFTHLKDSPFVSFYATTSWNEDLADYLTYYHLEHKLGGKVELSIEQTNGSRRSFDPVGGSLQQRRAASLAPFYAPAD